MKPWREFQNHVAAIFSALGADVSIEKTVQGVRAAHESDVLVELSQYGLRVCWIIECKCWESSVTKEKVMALQAIVSDTGVDKGILVSKVGFQSGAKQAVRNSNVALYTLEDLADLTKMDMSKAVLGRLELKGLLLRRELLKLSVRVDDGSVPGLIRTWAPQGAMEAVGMLSVLQQGFERAKLLAPPYLYPQEDDENFMQTGDIEEFAKKAKDVISAVELILSQAKHVQCDID